MTDFFAKKLNFLKCKQGKRKVTPFSSHQKRNKIPFIISDLIKKFLLVCVHARAEVGEN